MIRSFLTSIAIANLATPAMAQEGETAPLSVDSTDTADTVAILVSGRRDSQLDVIGGISVRDVPLSIRVVDAETIEDRDALNLAQMLFADPSFTSTNASSELSSSVTTGNIRGFRVNRYMSNGLPQGFSWNAAPAEAVERVEVLRGVSGFAYGFMSPGGAINVVTKSPRGESGLTLTGRATSTGSFGGHLEAEGQIAEQVGFRVNVAGEDGDTYLDGVTAKRGIAAAAFNYQPTDTTQIFFDANILRSITDGDVLGDTALFDTAGRLRTDLANTNFDFGVPEKYDVLNKSVNFRIVQDFGNDFTLVAAAQYANYREIYYQASFFGAIDANREVDFFYFPGLFTSEDIGASLVGTYQFKTGEMAHKLTITGQYSNGKTGFGAYGAEGGGRYNIDTGPLTPLEAPGPLTLTGDRFSDEYGVLVSYMVEPTPWSRLLAGVRYSSITARSQQPGSTSRVVEPGGDKTTPFVGVMIDFSSRLSVYGNYAQGLERGSRAPLDATNANTLLPPLISEQYEAGFKWDRAIGAAQLSGAVFQIERPNDYYLGPGTLFQRSGLQRNRGGELLISGKVLPEIALSGGITYLDAVVAQAANPAVNGSRSTGVPRWQFALAAEYAARYLPGLTLTAALAGQSSREVSLPNDGLKYPGFGTIDLGARYRTIIGKRDIEFRVRVDNIFNKRFVENYAWGSPRIGYLSIKTAF